MRRIAMHAAIAAMTIVVTRGVPALADAPVADAPVADAPAASPEASPAPAHPKLSEVKPMSEDMRIGADAIDSVMANPKIFFLDVREPKEIEELGSYEGYVNIPMSQLEARLGELPKDRPILTA
jgi:hypothetical protein